MRDGEAFAQDDHEVEQFARQNEITVEQARQLIKEHGHNRAILEIKAKKLRPA